MQCTYGLELFPVAMLIRDDVNFTCLRNKKVLVARIKSGKDLNLVVLPVYIELCLVSVKRASGDRPNSSSHCL